MPGIGTFISAGRSLDDAIARVDAGRRARLRLRLHHPHRRPRLADRAGRLRGGDRADPARHRRAADLLADAGLDRADRGDHRRVLGRADGARHRRLPQGHRRELVRRGDRQAGDPDARVRRASSGRSCAASRPPTASSSTPTSPSWATPPRPELPDLHRRALAEHAPARGRDRRRRDALALLARLHPRRRRPGGDEGPREGRQVAGGVRHRRRRPAALTDDRDAVLETMRADLVTYMSLPFYRSMLERSGLRARRSPPSTRAWPPATSSGRRPGSRERMLDALGGIGSADDVRAGVERYRDAGADLARRRRDPERPTSRRPSRPRPSCSSRSLALGEGATCSATTSTRLPSAMFASTRCRPQSRREPRSGGPRPAGR